MALLRELIGMEHLKPLHNNILCALLTLVYVKIYMEISSVLRIRLGKVMEARRFIHVCDSSLLIFWPLFDANHWSWRLNVLVPVVMAVRIFYKVSVLFCLVWFDFSHFKNSKRESERNNKSEIQYFALDEWNGMLVMPKQLL